MQLSWSRRISTGAGAGALATAPMSLVMLAAQRLGLLGKPPPATITDAALRQADAHPPRSQRHALAVLAHVGFGAAAGALFGLLRGGRPESGRAALEGAVFATGVWAASYAGWIPALGILPPPTRDRPGRPPSMIVAHWVYGAALGLAVARARR